MAPAPHRRNLSEILFPPQLAFPPPDPFEKYDQRDSTSTEDSDDESDDLRDEKALLAEAGELDPSEENEHEDGSVYGGAAKAARAKRRRFLLLAFPAGLASLLFVTFFFASLFEGHTFNGKQLKPISWEYISNGTFQVLRQKLDWLAEAGDGVYSYRTDDGSIVLQDVNTNTSRYLVRGRDVADESGDPLEWNSFKVSADMQYILFDTDYVKQWRHSSHANYWVHSLSTKETTLLHPRNTAGDPLVAIATFSPVEHRVAYVHGNDLYVSEGVPSRNGEDVVRVTADGSATTFNAVPDWVYEEEVFSSDTALWWAPDGQRIAYLSFDEAEVPEYEFPIYNPSLFTPGGDPYPKSTVMRYPKPGFPNPIVKIHVFDFSRYLSQASRPVLNDDTSSNAVDPTVLASTVELQFDKPFADDDVIISEVTWVGKDDLLVKATNRIASVQRVARFELSGGNSNGKEGVLVGKVVREDDFENIDGGWVEPGQRIVGIDSTLLLHSTKTTAPIPTYPAGYLDVIPDADGFNHLAYFSPPDASKPVFLTSGQWEIDGAIEAVDVSRGLVYFIAANPSIDRHLYSVPLPTTAEFAALQRGESAPPKPTVLSNDTTHAFHRTSFSPFAGFYVLSYEGPGIPWQRLVKVDDPNFEDVLADNAKLAAADAEFAKVETVFTTVSTGSELNVQELRPPNMDLSGRTKYPVLFSVYGGPASQAIKTTYFRDWHYFLCTTYDYVIVYVDPRGTGYKGRSFRTPVHDNLGHLEANDTVDAARYYSNLPYIDSKRVGIWGWSYGGFLTSKVIETNSSVFTLGMAVAPVTDWRYYDSIYTERYMSTPALNPNGYSASAVSRMEGFKNSDFALAHGSGDDNVHFLNTAVLLDRFTVGHVRDFSFRMFTDSDHSMSMRGAYWELMPWLSEFLVSRWGEGGRTKLKWKMTGHDKIESNGMEEKQ